MLYVHSIYFQYDTNEMTGLAVNKYGPKAFFCSITRTKIIKTKIENKIVKIEIITIGWIQKKKVVLKYYRISGKNK